MQQYLQNNKFWLLTHVKICYLQLKTTFNTYKRNKFGKISNFSSNCNYPLKKLKIDFICIFQSTKINQL